MAVYTHVPEDALTRFLSDYALGALQSYEGITQGVENTNYRLEVGGKRYILTLFEKRVDPKDIPFFINVMSFMAAGGIDAPQPIASRSGAILNELCGRPAIIISFLDGAGVEAPTAEQCRHTGALAAKMHLASQTLDAHRANALTLSDWRTLADSCAADADRCAPGLDQLIDEELDYLSKNWPQDLPTGVVHADLFPDNVFFENGAISGVIDFYFACTDAYAYDLAITLNAWAGCKGWREDRAKALLEGYQAVRPLHEKERLALPILLRGSAMRFLLTRLYDWLNQVEGAQVRVKDPLEYRDLLLAHRQRTT